MESEQKQDSSGLMQSLREQNGTSLLEAKNLGALIRKFIAQNLDVVARVSTGQINRGLGVGAAQANCRYFARIMTGAIQGAYSIDGKWFPTGLAKHIRAKFDIHGSDEEVIAEAWGKVLLQVFEVVNLDDETQQHAAIDDVVATSISLFAGIGCPSQCSWHSRNPYPFSLDGE